MKTARGAKKVAEVAWLAGARATSGRRVLPGFLVIGAQRAGSTSLWRYVQAHPAVVGSAAKEVHYFDLNYGRGESWYRAWFPTERRLRRLQTETGTRPVVGEASPYYIFHPLVPERVRALDREMKAIAILRDPVARAFSHYHHSRARGTEDLSFEEAIEREPERLRGEEERIRADPSYVSVSHQHHSYLARGRYAEQLERWYEHFPSERVLILSTDELAADRQATLGRVFEFLDLPAWTDGRETGRHNTRDYVDMSRETRERLIEQFREPNRRLYALLGRDLGWPA